MPTLPRTTRRSHPGSESSSSSTTPRALSSSRACSGLGVLAMQLIYWVLIGVVGFFIVAIILFRAFWRVAEPNEALIISGLGAHGKHSNPVDGMNFSIVTGGGKLVFPMFQVVRKLSLDLREADLAMDCVTHQGIPLGLRGVVIYKVGD